MLSILNNISSLQAENSLNTTSMNLNSTLQQLSTGQRINKGSDDPHGRPVEHIELFPHVPNSGRALPARYLELFPFQSQVPFRIPVSR